MNSQNHHEGSKSLLTIPTDITQSVLGYIVNTDLSAEGQEAISDIQSHLSAQFGDAFWPAPPETLHITLFDLITPVIAYPERMSVGTKQQTMPAITPRPVDHWMARQHLTQAS